MKQVGYVLIGLLVGFILAGGIFIVTRTPDGTPVALEPSPTKAPFEVHVVGDVVRPGVYSLPEGSRVQDAIDAAGGLLADAQVGSLNLAAKIEDGQQLQVGSGAAAAAVQTQNPGSNTSPFQIISTPSQQPSTDLLDINTATVEELDALPGISPTVAQRIIDYRDENGPYSQIEDIMNVNGIGPSTFDAIKNLITAEP